VEGSGQRPDQVDGTFSLAHGWRAGAAEAQRVRTEAALDATSLRYARQVDAIDSRILDLLRRNARSAYGDIGAVVGLSASAVKRRVDRLIADGVIRGFTVQVDPAVEGVGTEAWVELFCRGTVSPSELRRMLSAVPEVVYAGTVTGSADAIVHIRSRDIPGLEVALERVRVAPNVDHTRSAIVLSRLVNRLGS
jgi:DNA-binding Lrp family transcriptional regulator